MYKTFQAIIGAGALLTVATMADAATIQSRVFDDGVLQGAFSLSSGTGTLSNVSSATTHFSVSFNANGIPLLTSPGFSGVTTQISTAATGTHTIRIELTQTGVSTTGVLTGLANTLTTNLLNNANVISAITVTNYLDGSNAAFGTASMLAQLTAPNFTSGLSVLAQNGTGPTPGALFSETIVIQATFSGPGGDLLATSQMVGVPEPASLALLGAALLGLGFARRARQRTDA